MAQANSSARAPRRKTPDELIAEHREAIKVLERQKAKEQAKRQEKRYQLLGKAFQRAVTEGYINESVFTQLASTLIKPAELEEHLEDLPIILDEMQAYVSPPRGRPAPRKVKRTMRKQGSILSDLAQQQAAEAEAEKAAAEKAAAEEKEKEKEQQATQRSTTKEQVGEVKVTRRRKRSKSKAEKEQDTPEETLTPPTLDEADNDDAEDNIGNRIETGEVFPVVDLNEKDEEEEAIPAAVLDTSMPLYRIEAFNRRTRLIDRLGASGISTLGDLVRRTEKELMKIPNITTGTVRTCKAILTEMNLSLRK